MNILDILSGNAQPKPEMTPIDWATVPQNMQANAAPAQQPAPQPQGILSQGMGQGALSNPDEPGFMKRMGNFLMAAGSRDPSGTLLELQKADSLAAAGKKPKITPLADGAFSLVAYPDGTTRIERNEDVAKYLQDQKDRDAEVWKAKTIFKFDNQPLSAAEQKVKVDQLSAISTLEGDIKNISSTLQFGEQFKPGLGTQLAGTGIGRTIASIASGSSPDAANAARMQQQIQKVLATDWVKATEPLKGALSDREGARLAATQPLPTDDYETVIKPWMQSLQKWLNEGLEKAKANAERDLRTPPTAERKTDQPSSLAPAASVNADQVTAAFGSYEPNIYEYRVINGQVQRKKK